MSGTNQWLQAVSRAWSIPFSRNGNLGTGNWLRLVENDFPDSNSGRAIIPYDSTIDVITVSNNSRTGDYTAEVYINGVLTASFPLPLSDGVRTLANVDIPVVAGDELGIFLRRDATGQMNDTVVVVHGR